MAKKRLQIILSEESAAMLDNTLKEARQGFKQGRITYSDVINEMVLAAKLDIKMLQQRHKTFHKTLASLLADKEANYDKLMEVMADFRPKAAKRPRQEQLPLGEAAHE